jgi:predicted PurR-regulated permease PerM
VITPIVTFYFLRDWPGIIRHVDTWLPRPYEGVIRAQAIEVNRILAAWIRGQAICCLMLAAIYAVGLTIIGLDLGLVIGLGAGLLSFIPYVGTLVGVCSALLLVLSQSPGWHGVIAVTAVFALGQALNDYVIQPRFLGDRVGLPAVWVIFSLFAGGAAFGFLGIMLAVPVTATIGVLARFWLNRYLQSPLYLDTATAAEQDALPEP